MPPKPKFVSVVMAGDLPVAVFKDEPAAVEYAAGPERAAILDYAHGAAGEALRIQRRAATCRKGSACDLSPEEARTEGTGGVMDFEFYETAEPFTRWLFAYMRDNLQRIDGRCFEPCVGNGAIVRASGHRHWFTNDLDPRWPADVHKNAKDSSLWLAHEVDWTITNPPFTEAIPILAPALEFSREGVAMYLRLSIHEPLKEGPRRSFFAIHRPTAVLVLPRFAHQRSRTKGIWSTDSMTSCWCVWDKRETRQVIDYAPESVIDELEAFTPSYRERMDALMGFTGTEKQRQAQCIARWKEAA